jgi:hypothetical protein
VVEQGTHQELLAQEDSLYRHYHALQFQWDAARPQEPEPALLASAGLDDVGWMDSTTPYSRSSDLPAALQDEPGDPRPEL